MSAPALAGVDRPTLRIRGTAYPVMLPRLTDPRLHLAAVITSLQVLGQVAFSFDLSIAQILVSLLTCALIEVTVAFRRQRVILWPASALLTGNGVAFVLRVPGTEHGDWWSLHGWWVFAGTAAVAIGSKHVIRHRGSHVFNPSNLGLVLCFLLLGPELADPLALWWGPMSPWMALALAIIVAGGLAILSRLRLLAIAAVFWLTFAVGIAVLAASGHEMFARWHLGPITGLEFWRVLVFSPEVLIFLFFMITDPRTIPGGSRARHVYAAGVALLAVLLIAPQTTEFATKVALLGSLTLVCAARPFLEALARRRAATPAGARRLPSRVALGGLAVTAVTVLGAAIVVAGSPARPTAASAAVSTATTALPPIEVLPPVGLAAELDAATAERVTRDLFAALEVEAEAVRTADRSLAEDGATGPWLAAVWQKIDAGPRATVPVERYTADRVLLALAPVDGQGQPVVRATLVGSVTTERLRPGTSRVVERTAATPVERTFELMDVGGRYVIMSVEGLGTAPSRGPAAGGTLAAVRLVDVAPAVGLDLQQGAFRYGPSGDPAAMMGGGLCWLDYDADGWTDLFVVNGFAESDRAGFGARGGLPRSRLFRNERGRFRDITRRAGIDLQVKGTGCVAADLDLDGRSDLVVTTATYDPARNAYDALLWNEGDGTFTEGADAAGISDPGWHAGATVGDVDGDGLPDLFVAGYTDVNAPVPGSSAGFPTDHQPVRDLLYLNQGPGPDGRPRFREVGRAAGLERTAVGHGLGAVFTDLDLDGRLDLVVANDEDPNSAYVNVPWPGGRADDPAGLGFRLEDRAPTLGLDDEHAGMGVAVADAGGDGRPDLVVTNSRDQLHAAAWSDGERFVDARPGLAPALPRSSTGWGTAWIDLDNDSHLDLVIANGAIPVTSLRRDAQRVQVLQNLGSRGEDGRFADASRLVGLGSTPRVNGRGLAAADYDNDGDVDVAVNTIGGRLQLLRNDGAPGRWLEVRLAGRRLGPGTRVTVELDDGRRLVREVQAGGSYLSSHDPRLHFGLGDAVVRSLVVRSTDGRERRLEGVGANRVVSLSDRDARPSVTKRRGTLR
ncbi:MAG: FG-GAP-like repeat-containing protein [Gaiella sp.]